MTLDYTTLALLRQNHPAWRLLRSDHAPLVASFLQRVFIAPNLRVMAQADLAEALEDELFALRERLGAEAFPKSALEYLNDWTSTEKGWLRKFYRQGSDEPHFDLTPATEKAIAWLGTLTARSFVGTESRLLTLFELLKQMSEGSETDPQARIVDLHKRRDEIDLEIARIVAGDIPLLDDTALKDRFQQFMALARELLTDFREVEHNFRGLDRRVRERIALWEGAKGALLEEIMGERDAIADSDQGRSFRAFWGFLMSSSRQEELRRAMPKPSECKRKQYWMNRPLGSTPCISSGSMRYAARHWVSINSASNPATIVNTKCASGCSPGSMPRMPRSNACATRSLTRCVLTARPSHWTRRKSMSPSRRLASTGPCSTS
jgi:hypothetical protein